MPGRPWIRPFSDSEKVAYAGPIRTLVFLALGSNIDPETHLRAAALLLRARWPGIRFSGVYKTAPMGYEQQDDFLNAAAAFEAEKSPQEIHDALRSMELSLKKSTPFPSGPRTIDLDLLLYGDRVSDQPPLALPHPRMHERRFVLAPLCELIDPAAKHPRLGVSWQELLHATAKQACKKTSILL